LYNLHGEEQVYSVNGGVVTMAGFSGKRLRQLRNRDKMSQGYLMSQAL